MVPRLCSAVRMAPRPSRPAMVRDILRNREKHHEQQGMQEFCFAVSEKG
jgi:hypothetical protein